jgi:hypothetical protein
MEEPSARRTQPTTVQFQTVPFRVGLPKCSERVWEVQFRKHIPEVLGNKNDSLQIDGVVAFVPAHIRSSFVSLLEARASEMAHPIDVSLSPILVRTSEVMTSDLWK